MIEPIMYLAIGFLVSMLFGLMIVPLVHNRAVRLTTRRLEAETPLSMAEIQADKDQLRAEFAMSARRLEMNVEQLKNKTTSQLAELGVKPADVTYVALSHTHGDHVGNIALFGSSTVLIQGAEYDWAMAGANKPAFAVSEKFERLAGDHDVFGDGSVTILSTPGHTPGHQSLLVRLPKTGSVVLSGDAVHFRDNWEHRRVPSMNKDRAQTLASLQRLQSVLDERRAQLWINHDKAQSEGLRYAPAYYE